jgi:hypothetical protein
MLSMTLLKRVIARVRAAAITYASEGTDVEIN